MSTDLSPTQIALPVLGDEPPASQSTESVADAAGSDAAPAPHEPAYGRAYWRSIAEQQGSPDVEAARGPEFPEGADLPPQGFARREFLQLAGASLALAGLNACTEKPTEPILPYTKNPQGLAPGIPLHYATAARIGDSVSGLLVTAWEGRPTKVDGNPLHPVNRGATGIWEQAWLAQLYDGNRAKEVREGKTPRAWRTFLEVARARAATLEKTGGQGLRFWVEPTTSPLLLSMREQVLARFPKARFYSYAALHHDTAVQGAQLAFGAPFEVQPSLVDADVVLSLDADFVEPRGNGLRNARDFADRRDPKRAGAAGLNRLYVVEPAFTLTGMMADHRVRIRASEVQSFALALLGQLAGRIPGLSRFAGLAQKHAVPARHAKLIGALASDLADKRGRSLVLAGDRQPPLVHALAHLLNAALGNVGKTVRYSRPLTPDSLSGPAGYAPLLQELKAGQVDTLIVTAQNPVYSAPADVPLEALLQKISFSAYLSLYEDETAAVSRWLVPLAHPLEAWGDHRAADGTISIAQPLIQPLHNGMTEADVLGAFLAGPEKTPYVRLKESWAKRPEAGIDFESSWERWLVDGFIPGTSVALETPAVQEPSVLAAAEATPVAPSTVDGLEVQFAHDYKLFDGRFANIPWLQELPDPITKLTWDNAALVSPTTAKRLGLKDEDVVHLKYQGKELLAPVMLAPGHADDAVTLTLGWGRDGVGEELARDKGFSGYALRQSKASGFDGGLSLEKVHRTHKLSLTQTHWSMKMDWEEKERPIALVQTLAAFQHENHAEEQRGALPNFYEQVKYDDYRWAMSIDLARCTGCSACAVACQAENNIPVVGKEQVANGREMAWLRIDRYFSGPIEDPAVVTQPVMCMHCENAPCEYVCPVNATVHSDEGLNEMVYNRCIGTRYCSNNCPYKVRRFNYLHWQADRTQLEKMKMNPDVTVRARGVMEKCTYCVQRIERTRIQARTELNPETGQKGRPIRDGELRTACQQACPTQAIVFGTLSDRNARVTQLHEDERRYDLLHALGTRPRTGYLLRLTNPHPELA